MKLTPTEYVQLLTRRPKLRPLPPTETAAARVAALMAREAQTTVPPPKRAGKGKPVPKKPRQGSHLEEKFLRIWQSVGGPALEREVKLIEGRKFRADFVHRPSRTAIEIQGGVWKGRHTHGTGFTKDCEKTILTFCAGWTVIPFAPANLTRDLILAVAMRCALNSNPTP